MNLNGRVVIVTGGSRGIGRSIACRLAAAGMKVIITYRCKVAEASEFVAEVEQLGGVAAAVKVDVTSSQSVDQGFDEVFERFGGVDALVNNAGISTDRVLPHEVSESVWNEHVEVNLTGAFRCCKAVLPQMLKRGSGKIVMISSVAALRGGGSVHYCASKAGQLGLTLALASQLATKGITVNAVAPGMIDTEMQRDRLAATGDDIAHQVPMGRLGTPTEISDTVAFLLSNDYITGEIINVSGGRHIAL